MKFSATRVARYPGDLASTFTPGEAKGPGTDGREFRFVRAAAYDDTTGTTTVVFDFSPDPQAFADALDAEARALPPIPFARLAGDRPDAPCANVPTLGWRV